MGHTYEQAPKKLLLTSEIVSKQFQAAALIWACLGRLPAAVHRKTAQTVTKCLRCCLAKGCSSKIEKQAPSIRIRNLTIGAVLYRSNTVSGWLKKGQPLNFDYMNEDPALSCRL
jgi:hypothetical protein